MSGGSEHSGDRLVGETIKRENVISAAHQIHLDDTCVGKEDEMENEKSGDM